MVLGCNDTVDFTSEVIFKSSFKDYYITLQNLTEPCLYHLCANVAIYCGPLKKESHEVNGAR